MAYTPVENRLGIQPIAQPVQATQFYSGQIKLGDIIRAQDPTYGGGEFIYLYGVASTLLGSLVTYDPFNGTTPLSPATTGSKKPQPLAVAMSACISGYYGWYQIAGAAVIKKTAVKVSPNVALYLSGTAGR